jgi:hypothetical protein
VKLAAADDTDPHPVATANVTVGPLSFLPVTG